MKELKKLAYKLRQDVVDMIVNGKGGHIGGDMSVMDTLVTLYFKEMNISVDNFNTKDHDHFIMSKGHSVEALYAVLAEKGFFPIEQVIKEFSKSTLSSSNSTPFSSKTFIEICLRVSFLSNLFVSLSNFSYSS